MRLKQVAGKAWLHLAVASSCLRSGAVYWLPTWSTSVEGGRLRAFAFFYRAEAKTEGIKETSGFGGGILPSCAGFCFELSVYFL